MSLVMPPLLLIGGFNGCGYRELNKKLVLSRVKAIIIDALTLRDR
jgi:hypothetical protein